MRGTITLRLIALHLCALLFAARGSNAQGKFYSTAPHDLASKAAPGSLIRSQPIDGAPNGAAAYRVLYRSIGLAGEPIAVSGVVIIPAGSPPPQGRPIIAWAHPTTGIVSRCAIFGASAV